MRYVQKRLARQETSGHHEALQGRGWYSVEVGGGGRVTSLCQNIFRSIMGAPFGTSLARLMACSTPSGLFHHSVSDDDDDSNH